MSSSNGSRDGLGFWSGVVSTLILILGLGVFKHLHELLASNATVEKIVGWLTEPIFSVADVVTFLLLLLVGYVIVWTAAFGPRVSH